MPVAIKSRLAWEVLFVQPLAQQMDNGQIKGTLHLCQLISQHYDKVVKTGFCNFPPTGPTPPAPMMSGKTPLFQTSAFVGFKATEVLNLVSNPPLVLAEKALAFAIKKNKDTIDKLMAKKEEIEPYIEQAKQAKEKFDAITAILDLVKAKDYMGAIDAGAKEFESPIIPGFDKLKEKASELSEPQLKKELNKKIEKEKVKLEKKLEPLKLKIDKKIKTIEVKVDDLKKRVTAKITQKIAQAQAKKAKLVANTAKAASMSYVQTIEANIELAKQKIEQAKELAKKVKVMVDNAQTTIQWGKDTKVKVNEYKEFAKNLPELKDILKELKELPKIEPPEVDFSNTLGFGKMNLDIRSKNFEIPNLPGPPNITEEVTEIKEKGIDAIRNSPTLKRKIVKLKDKVEKVTKKLEQKKEKIEKKVEKLKTKLEDKKKEIQDKATAAGLKLLKKLIPPGDKDPTAMIKMLKEKKEKVEELIKKIQDIKKEVEEKIVEVTKKVEELIERGKAIKEIYELIKEGSKVPFKDEGKEKYFEAIDKGAEQFKSPVIPGFDTLKETKDELQALDEPKLKKVIMKKVEKIMEKNKKLTEKYEKKLDVVKKRIEKKLKPIEERLDKYKGFITAGEMATKPPEVEISGKIIATALSVGLIGYWTGGTLAPAAPGGVVLFPGIPLIALKTLDGKPALEEIAKVFNKDSELDNADKMRTLANVFEAHMKTVAGLWQMPTPAGPVPTPWISYG